MDTRACAVSSLFHRQIILTMLEGFTTFNANPVSCFFPEPANATARQPTAFAAE